MTNFSRQTGLFGKLRQWVTTTPDRALDKAYEAALEIRQIEADYFDGQPISKGDGNYSSSAYRLLQKDLDKYLGIIKRQMTAFKASSSVLPVNTGQLDTPLPDDVPVNQISGPAIFFSKLQLVDETLEKYRQPSTFAVPAFALNQLQTRPLTGLAKSEKPGITTEDTANEALTSRSSVLPRSILRTVDRIKQDLDPDAETEVVRNFRMSKTQTTVAITFVLQLVIVPLLAQYLSKNFIVHPIVAQVRNETQAEIFLNSEMEEEALHELQQYEERLRFEVLLGKTPEIGEREIEGQVRQKAALIEEEYRDRSADAVNNVFADAIAVITFSLLLTNCKEKVATLKAFIDEIVYGLSDSAKAFLIILFTDTFVGFHSPHGWEVLLEGMANHLGLPANRNFIFLFIATFPVILDTVFKYWIFRYLNRISPSAVATYKNMNE
ncbi:MAG: proton extrusion protein PcxA [Phormidesmis sp.]